MKSLSKFNFLCFITLVALTYVLIGLTNHYILTIDFYQSSGNPLSGIPGQEITIYENMKKWIYFSALVCISIKIFVISLLLYTALFLAGYNTSINHVLKTVILSEYLFLIPAALKIVWFHCYYPAGTLSEWHRFYILSALSLVGEVPQDWCYALQTLNVFEVIYWFTLAIGIAKTIKIPFDNALKVVITSYLPALIIWVTLVSFCTIMIFPGTA